MRSESAGAPLFATLPLRERLRIRANLLGALRGSFVRRGYVEVETPLRVLCPGIDPYVDAFPAGDGLYLATSPELHMKRLVAADVGRVFQLTRAFRAGELGERHYGEFSILEWYAKDEQYVGLMAETEALVQDALDVIPSEVRAPSIGTWRRPFVRVSVDDAFHEHAGWRPSSAEPFDPDRFFYDLIDKVEPSLAALGAVFLFDYPARLGALARRRLDEPGLAERFELYLDGLEVCNGFTELTDPEEQRTRFERDNRERAKMGKEPYPIDERFLRALESGLPGCAGNALGVDRLLMALTGCRRMVEATAFPREDL